MVLKKKDGKGGFIPTFIMQKFYLNINFSISEFNIFKIRLCFPELIFTQIFLT